MQRRKSILGFVLALTGLLLVIRTPPVSAHRSGGYFHGEVTAYHNPDWMASLPDTVKISELSIPGTHDTMALHGGDSVQCQSMSLATQLETGIRVLDIRCRHIEDAFAIHHGSVFQDAWFGNDVLKPVVDFLRAHPGETVLMRVKEEHDPAGNTRTFAETFEWYLDQVYQDGETSAPYGDWVWTGTSLNPTLGAVRGKIVILQNFAGGDYGISWGNANIQDDYSVATNWDLDDKWYKIRDHAIAADTGDMDDLYINFLSGSFGSFPYFVASGHSSHETGAPRLWTGLLWDNVTGSTCGSTDCYPFFPRLNCVNIFGWKTCSVYFEGTNEIMAYYWLAQGKVENRTGIVMADFPGPALIKEIIDVNPIAASVAPVLPTADAGGPYSGTEGSEVLFDASGSSDPQGDALMYLWDFDHDLIRDTYWSGEATAGYTWGDDWSGTVWVMVSDGETSDADIAVVIIHNVAPAVDVPTVSPEPSDEGSTVVASATFADPGSDDGPFTCMVHYGDGSEAQVGTVSDTTCTGPEHVYADNGSYTVTIAVTDKDGGMGSTMAGHEVNNVGPTATFGNDGPVDEGSSFTLTLTEASDPSTADTTAGFEYAFDCGDGSGYTDFSASNSATCATDDSGTRSVWGKVRDQDGGQTEYDATVTVNDLAPPSAAFSWTPEPQDEGSPTSFSDASTSDGDAIVGWAWDLGGQGASVEQNPTFSFADDGVYHVCLTVTDDDGSTNQGCHDVSVSNTAPSAAFNAPTEVNEGSNIVLSLTDPSDPSSQDTAAGFQYAFDCGDGNGYGVFSTNNSATCTTDDNGTRTVRAKVQDKDGGFTEYTGGVTFNNVAPTADFAVSPLTLDEEQNATATFSNAYDPSSADAAAGFTYSYDCQDDGSFEKENVPDTSYTCPYPDNGTFALRGRIRDKDGGVTEYTASVVVNNVAPTVDPITAPLEPVPINAGVSVSAVFADPGVHDTHTAVWDWDDDTISGGTVTEEDGSGSVAGTHTYTTAGVYTIQLTVTDKDGGSGTSLYEYVVIYNPDGCFVTGGGWIYSEAGAYRPDPGLSGRATFGFFSRYKKGASAPTGNTDFRFRVGGFDFHSDSYEWLVVNQAGTNAQFKGEGTVNGEGLYKFMLWAGDGAPDTFRIRIWWEDGDGEHVVYDNGTDQAIGGGSIIVHD